MIILVDKLQHINFLLFKIKTKMQKLWKMVVSDEFYKEIIEETKEIIKDFNMDFLVNREEKI